MNSWTRRGLVLAPALLLLPFCASMGCMVGDRHLAARGPAPDGGLGGGTGATFGTPVLVTGLRGPGDVLQDPTLSADELELYFMSVTGADANIWSSQRAAATDPWGAASMVAELSTAAREEDPDLAPDGLSVYFSSDRGGEAGAMRLWFARRSARGQPWGPPEELLGLGASREDVAPSVDASGLRLVFASMRDDIQAHLFSAARLSPSVGWGPAEDMTSVNSAFQDRDPAVFAQGGGLVFASRRTGQGRTSDLFLVTRSDAALAFVGPPAAISELNTDAWEGDAWMSQAGNHIVFVSDRTGTPRIYEAWR